MKKKDRNYWFKEMNIAVEPFYTWPTLNRRVSFEWIGEGWDGDYDMYGDPGDEPLYRFYIQQEVDGEWVDIDDESWCTALPIDTPPHLLALFSGYLVDASGNDRELQWLTWTSADELREAYDSEPVKDKLLDFFTDYLPWLFYRTRNHLRWIAYRIKWRIENELRYLH